MGIYKELSKNHSPSLKNYIKAVRMAQGNEEWADSTEEQRLHIVSQWYVAAANAKHARNGVKYSAAA